MKNWTYQKKSKVTSIVLAVVFIIYLVHATYNSIWLYRCEYCSAPWYLELLFSSLIFALPILGLVFLKIYFLNKQKIENTVVNKQN